MEGATRQSNWHPDRSTVAHSTVVCNATSDAGGPSTGGQARKEVRSQGEASTVAPSTQKAGAFNRAYIGRMLTHTGVSSTSTTLINSVWRDSTRGQYDSVLRTWEAFCSKRAVNPFGPSAADVLNYLSEIYDRGLGYNSVAKARSALGNFISLPGFPHLADHPLIERLVKGVFNLRPPAPRYTYIWDSRLLITYLQTLKTSELNLKMLTYKTASLLTVLSGQRVSTVYAFDVNHIQQSADVVVCNITTLLKTSKPGRPTPPIVFNKYPHNADLRPVTLIRAYLQKRNTLSLIPTTTRFLVTHQKPHHAASKDTIARWVKAVLHLSGVDTTVFAAHSCRSASSSQAKSAGLPLEDILRCGQWRSEDVFVKFYDKEIQRKDYTENQSFATAILDTATNLS